jgi:hypothetical protein
MQGIPEGFGEIGLIGAGQRIVRASAIFARAGNED